MPPPDYNPLKILKKMFDLRRRGCQMAPKAEEELL
jgi:hypothetical protein